MKIGIVFLMGLLGLFLNAGINHGCKQKSKADVPDINVGDMAQPIENKSDSLCHQIRIQDSIQIATLNEQLTEVVMQLNAAAYQNEIIKRKADSLRAYVALGNFKMNRLKYYINIVVRNNSQIKFLKGWSNRVDTISIKDLPK